MKKNTSPLRRRNAKEKRIRARFPALPEFCYGVDLGDRRSCYVLVNSDGEEIEEGEFDNTVDDLKSVFADGPRARVVLETGGQSAWISRAIEGLGHELLIANARDAGGKGARKNDRRDAEQLARCGRLDPVALNPTRVRGEQAQAGLTRLRVREALVRARTQLINAVRSTAKAYGERVVKCSTNVFAERARTSLSAETATATESLLSQIESLSEKIREADRGLRQAAEAHPAARLLMTANGVGPLTALTFVHTIDEPQRFRKSRETGPYLGLIPRQKQSGDADPQLGISKAGDERLRRLLVQCAHYILGPFGTDSTLRRWGLKYSERGGKNARKRAIVAVARKLAVALHRMWTTGEKWKAFPAVG